jgi:mono/diheme cytochrome c family protein
MRKLVLYSVFILTATLMVSCGNEYSRKPGRVYAPDMVYSRAVDYYNTTEKITAEKGVYNKMPAAHSIAREQPLPDHIGENDSVLSKAQTCSYELVAKDVEEGKRLYMIYCGICHGTALDGNGPLYSSGKFAAMPANLKSGEKYLKMSQGQIYHAIVYGKNSMGSYASQLDTKQRWLVVSYIKKIQSENGGEPFTMVKGTPTNDSLSVKKADAKSTENVMVKATKEEAKTIAK